MKNSAVFFSLMVFLAISPSIYADTECQIGSRCAIAKDDGDIVSYRVNKDLGNDFNCMVLSDGNETRVKVYGDSQFLISPIYEYSAQPNVIFNVHGEYNFVANYGYFNIKKVGGVSGKVICGRGLLAQK